MSDKIIEKLEEIGREVEVQGHAHVEFKKVNNELQEKIKKGEGGQAELEQKIAKIEEKDIHYKEKLEADLVQLKAAVRANVNAGNGDKKEITPEQKATSNLWNDYLRNPLATESKMAAIASPAGQINPEFKDLSVGKNPNGGYWVTPDMSGRMVKRIFETSPIRSVCSVQPISTDSLEGPIDDGEAQAEWVSETGTRATTTLPDIGEWKISVHEMFAAPLVSQKLIEDSTVDPQAYATGKIGERFSRKENASAVNGSGAGQMHGFLAYDASSDPDVYERDTVGQVAGVSTSGTINYDDLYNLSYSLKESYRLNSTFAANRFTFKIIRKLKDDNGLYLWEPNTQVGQPAMINAIPTIEFNDMPVVASNSLSVAIADWKQAYQIVDRIGFSLLVDPYTAVPWVKYYARRRVGGGIINWDAIKLLKTKS